MQVAKGILCFDFDGTLIDSNSVPAFNLEFLDYVRALQNHGAVWVVNSGRSLFQLLQGFGEHGFTSMPDYLMVKERELYQLGDYNRWVDFGDWNEKCKKEHKKFNKANRKFFKEVQAFVATLPDARFVNNEPEPPGVRTVDNEQMETLLKFLEEHGKDIPELDYERNEVYMRFSHTSYNKGTVLGELGRLLDVPPQHIFAAGDNHNDISMLNGEYAYGIACPSNSVPDVKNLVASNHGFVATQPGSSGMIQALEHYFFQQPANS